MVQWLNGSIKNSLENLYISPLELCNLNCQFCYTQKTKNILSNEQILDFVARYQDFLKTRSHLFSRALSPLCGSHSEKKNGDKRLNLKSIILCGGEVFTLKNFPDLVNQLIDQGIFISIITNGTIDRLEEIKNPRNCQLIVSLDGPKEVHDNNRGTGNFDKSIKFIEHAKSLDFPVNIFYLVTKDSYPFKDTFSKKLYELYKLSNFSLTFLTDRLNSLTTAQVLDIKKNYPTYPSKNLGCYQISLQSDGLIYPCCETNRSIGKITDPIEKIVQNYLDSFKQCLKCKSEVDNFSEHSERVTRSGQPEGSEHRKNLSTSENICNGCCDPDFLCGYKKELSQLSCKDVVKSFNDH